MNLFFYPLNPQKEVYTHKNIPNSKCPNVGGGIINFGNNSTIKELSELLYSNSLHIKGHCTGTPCKTGLSKIRELIEPVVRNGEPLNFALPAFPFKSPSLDKSFTLSIDKAEEVSIAFLNKITIIAKEIYDKGMKINIFSDGLMFAPIKGVGDKVAIDYSKGLKEIIERLAASDINLITLDDLYRADYEKARAEILLKYGKSLEQIQQNIKVDGLLNNMFCGIHRFYTEERIGQHPELTNSANNKAAKKTAYEVIQAAHAFSGFISQQIPHSLRFSCHPQPCNSSKIGLALVENGNQITPWHSVAVKKTDGTFVLMKNKCAKDQNLKLIINPDTNTPSHYEVLEGQNLIIEKLNDAVQAPSLLE